MIQGIGIRLRLCKMFEIVLRLRFSDRSQVQGERKRIKCKA